MNLVYSAFYSIWFIPYFKVFFLSVLPSTSTTPNFQRYFEVLLIGSIHLIKTATLKQTIHREHSGMIIPNFS
jgi:hypothetical protein